MKILQVNKFFYFKGGPEKYFFNLSALLERKGHSVACFSMKHEKNVSSEWDKYFVDNIDYNKNPRVFDKCSVFMKTLYSKEAENNLLALVKEFRPDIAHLHNYHHQLTPSILRALKKMRIPVVAKLPDFKMVCPSYSLLNHGKVCELCSKGRFYNSLFQKCHKGSYAKSLAVMLESYLHHNILKSYKNIESYICPSEFLMNKVKEMGLKGNFVYLPNFAQLGQINSSGNKIKPNIVYWGRISGEKGLITLIDSVKESQIKLNIIGNGPMKEEIETKILNQKIDNVKMYGHLSGDILINTIKESSVCVLPSECYENNPNTILEAFALGMPVIAANIGGIPELVKDGITGLLFDPGDSEDLRRKIKTMFEDHENIKKMGEKGKEIIVENFNPETHYENLIKIYEEAIRSNNREKEK